MVTKNPRINVTFEEVTSKMLFKLASQEKRSVSSLVRELALEALGLREDLYLAKIAESSDKEDAKTYNHDDVWK